MLPHLGIILLLLHLRLSPAFAAQFDPVSNLFLLLLKVLVNVSKSLIQGVGTSQVVSLDLVTESTPET